MIPVAALLILLVALFTIAILINNNAPVAVNPNGTIELSLFGARVAVNEIGLFCCGAATMLVLIVALMFLRSGLRRARISRRERKNLLNAASGQGKIARKEPSAMVLPGRSGAVDSGSSTAGASTASPSTASPSTASSSITGSTSAATDTTSRRTTEPRNGATPSSTSGGSGSASRSAGSRDTSPRLSVPPMKSPPPERRSNDPD